MTITSLAQLTDLVPSGPGAQAPTPLYDIVKNWSTTAQQDLLNAATQHIEELTDRRLIPFTNLQESIRAQDVDADSDADIAIPYDTNTMLGYSRAVSLGTTQMVRHMRVHHWPAHYPDLWTGSLSQVVIYRSFSGQQTITVAGSTIQFEADTGHVRFSLGTYIPIGSTLVATYSGGYSTVPRSLVRACLKCATEMALGDMRPQQPHRGDFDEVQLHDEWMGLIAPYMRY